MSDSGTVIVVAGEALVDLVSDRIGGGLDRAERFVMARGGAMANTAAGLARLGARARFAGQTGADPFGVFLRRGLAEDGVDVRWFVQSEDYKTGLVFVVRDERMVPSYFFVGGPSADMMLGEDEVGEDTLEGAGWLHVGTVTMAAERARAACLKLVRLAGSAGVRVSFDPNFRLHLWKDFDLLRKLTLETAAASALVKLNEDEMEFLTGEKDLAAGAGKLLALGPDAVVVTRGPAGALYWTREESGEAAGFAVEAVDTMGAGDAFAAGLLYSIANTKWPPGPGELERALRFANAVGALVCTEIGALTALPTREEADRFIRQRSPTTKTHRRKEENS